MHQDTHVFPEFFGHLQDGMLGPLPHLNLEVRYIQCELLGWVRVVGRSVNVVVAEREGSRVWIWHKESELVLAVSQTLHGASSKAGVLEPRADEHTLEHCGLEVPFS